MAVIGIAGTGYVGLVTGLCFASLGHEVICLDQDKDKVHQLSNDILPFFEPLLDDLLNHVKNRKSVKFTDKYRDLKPVGYIFIAVGTPATASGSTDLSAVENVISSLAPAIQPGAIIVLKSTVPPGTHTRVSTMLRDLLGSNFPFSLVSNPEFLRQGTAVHDFLHPDRIIIGAHDADAARKVADLYQGIEAPVLFMDPTSAELTKYAANAFLATKISFINELALLAEAVGADITEIARGIGADRRIGATFLDAGIGFGGSCFPKDVASLIHTASNHNCRLRILEQTLDVNASQKRLPAIKLERALGNLSGKVIALIGLSYKPNTDDLREAPSVDLISHLSDAGALIRAYDPVAIEKARHLFPNVHFCTSVRDAVYGADAAVLVTEWPEFRRLDLGELAQCMKRRVLIDGRNLFDKAAALSHGFQYYGIGR